MQAGLRHADSVKRKDLLCCSFSTGCMNRQSISTAVASGYPRVIHSLLALFCLQGASPQTTVFIDLFSRTG